MFSVKMHHNYHNYSIPGIYSNSVGKDYCRPTTNLSYSIEKILSGLVNAFPSDWCHFWVLSFLGVVLLIIVLSGWCSWWLTIFCDRFASFSSTM